MNANDISEQLQLAHRENQELLTALKWTLMFIDTYAKYSSGPATPEINKCRATVKTAEQNSQDSETRMKAQKDAEDANNFRWIAAHPTGSLRLDLAEGYPRYIHWAEQYVNGRTLHEAITHARTVKPME